ncbi:TPA: hypothetical protein RVR73_002822 [Aeromonas hydrophila]|nr:hypothetical protein [Aeromonas hydrophila]
MTTLTVGQIWSCDAYCPDESGQPKTKYLLIIGFNGDELVYKTLTSRSHGRPTNPFCFHGLPYPSYYMGVPHPNGILSKESWLDLRETDDFPVLEFEQKISNGIIKYIFTLNQSDMCALLDCAARADDTTRRQSNAILDARMQAGC